MNKVNQTWLDNFAESYYGNENVKDLYLENLIQIQVIPKLLNYITPEMKILEMGYGDGAMTTSLEKSGIKTDIIEGSKILYERAREKHPERNIIHSMFEDFNTTTQYDCVLCFHTLEHVEDAKRVIKKIASWLKKGGIIIAIVPNAESIHRRLALEMGLQKKLNDLSARDHSMGHLRVYNLKELIADFESAGLKHLESFGNFLKILPNNMMMDFSDELIKALCKIDVVKPEYLANIGIVARNC